MTKKEYYKNMKRGAVSIYVVIFTTLLLSIISLGFMRIMMAEQRSASNQDLSNSAFDSAMAGVEDGKIVVLAYHECKGRNDNDIEPRTGLNCGAVRNAIKPDNCDTVYQSRFGSAQNIVETPVGESQEDSELNQAYTCLTITPDTNDYLMTLSPDGQSEIVPLYFQGGNTIRSIVVRWWRDEDANGALAFDSERCRGGSAFDGLRCFLGRTTQGEPPIIRWQLVDGGDNYVLHDDNMMATNTLNSEQKRATLFFVPTSRSENNVWGLSGTGNRPAVPSSIVFDSGKAVNRTEPTSLGFNQGNTPLPVHCGDFEGQGRKGYACAVRIILPNSINTSTNRNSMLRLTAYNGATASVSVEGWNSVGNDGNIIKFEGVQPEIDSTGRASDLFRRVFSRVSLTSGFPYPEWSLELTGDSNPANLCKNFAVYPEGVRNYGCN
jgi:hypothetical protein